MNDPRTQLRTNLLGLRRGPGRPPNNPLAIRKPARKHLDRIERLAIFKAIHDRGASPEACAIVFQCSVGSVLQIANLGFSEVADLAEGCGPVVPTQEANP